MTKTRNTSIELLRLVLMLSIVMLHIFGTHIQITSDAKPVFYLELLIVTFCTIGVDTYVFISGYYGIKYKLDQLVKLYIQVIFYSLVIYLSFVYFSSEPFSYIKFIKYLLPLLSGVWWYMSAYFVLYFLSPLLNAGIEQLDRKQFKTIVIALLISCCISIGLFDNKALGGTGYTFFPLITIYLLARYMRLYDIKIKRSFILFLVSILSLFFISVCLMYWNVSVFKLLTHVSPFVILASVCLFFTFNNINFNNKFINKIASYSLAIYLIHKHPIVFSRIEFELFQILPSNSLQENLSIILSLLVFSLIIAIVCICIEFLRVKLFGCITKLYHRIYH